MLLEVVGLEEAAVEAERELELVTFRGREVMPARFDWSHPGFSAHAGEPIDPKHGLPLPWQ